MTSRKSFAIAFLAAVAIFIAAHFLHFRGSVPEFAKTSGGGVLLDMKPEFSEDGLIYGFLFIRAQSRRFHTTH